MCDRANLQNSLAGEMLQFCNGRVTEDCVGGKSHCPRWKTNKWREFCEEDLGSHFPVQHDRLVWQYCKDHPLDEACDCLAGEYVDPNASYVEATDAIPCGEPRACIDADGKEVEGVRLESKCGTCVGDAGLTDQEGCEAAGKTWAPYFWQNVPKALSKERYDRRRFTCMTYNGDTVKQVGTMNRNMWVSACNPALAETNPHVLLPKHKWAAAKGSKSCDIDVQSDLYQEGDHCPLSEYDCQQQEVPETVCINILDLRNQTCVAVGGGTCTKVDNLSQVNSCGFQDVAKKQNECYARPECKNGGCSYTFSNRLLTEPHLVDGAIEQVSLRCETAAQCPRPEDCEGDCSIMCLGGGGQNCVGNKCSTEKGDCYRVTQTCSTDSADSGSAGSTDSGSAGSTDSGSAGSDRLPARARRRPSSARPVRGGTVRARPAGRATPRAPRTPWTPRTAWPGSSAPGTRRVRRRRRLRPREERVRRGREDVGRDGGAVPRSPGCQRAVLRRAGKGLGPRARRHLRRPRLPSRGADVPKRWAPGAWRRRNGCTESE